MELPKRARVRKGKTDKVGNTVRQIDPERLTRAIQYLKRAPQTLTRRGAPNSGELRAAAANEDNREHARIRTAATALVPRFHWERVPENNAGLARPARLKSFLMMKRCRQAAFEPLIR